MNQTIKIGVLSGALGLLSGCAVLPSKIPAERQLQGLPVNQTQVVVARAYDKDGLDVPAGVYLPSYEHWDSIHYQAPRQVTLRQGLFGIPYQVPLTIAYPLYAKHGPELVYHIYPQAVAKRVPEDLDYRLERRR